MIRINRNTFRDLVEKNNPVKPCPFCGHFYPQLLESSDLCWINCLDCDCDGPPKETPDKAIEAWNTRPYLGDGKK